mmetsp:Transcript_46210/g.98960  ORF Transcript_46210/g.98960 Transcript_46210/m.98960 type:complete len:202 (+) Transcript_46210:124-729(+)
MELPGSTRAPAATEPASSISPDDRCIWPQNPTESAFFVGIWPVFSGPFLWCGGDSSVRNYMCRFRSSKRLVSSLALRATRRTSWSTGSPSTWGAQAVSRSSNWTQAASFSSSSCARGCSTTCRTQRTSRPRLSSHLFPRKSHHFEQGVWRPTNFEMPYVAWAFQRVSQSQHLPAWMHKAAQLPRRRREGPRASLRRTFSGS